MDIKAINGKSVAAIAWETDRRVEREIVSKVAENVFKDGYRIMLTCEGEPIGDTELHTGLNDEFMSDAFACDSCVLHVVDSKGQSITFVHFIYGNEGCYVVADCGERAQQFMISDEEQDMYEGQCFG